MPTDVPAYSLPEKTGKCSLHVGHPACRKRLTLS
jgi:hypothetical protein